MQFFFVIKQRGAPNMMSISKILLTGAVAVAAIALSAAPSEAAKKKAKAPCLPGPMCSSGKATGVNSVNFCGVDGKLYKAQVTPTCMQPFCPPKCG
jgi:hypothetical protein